MDVIVLSRSPLFGEMLADFCRLEGYETSNIERIQAVASLLKPNCILLADYTTGKISWDCGSIHALKTRNSGSKFVAIVPELRAKSDFFDYFDAVLNWNTTPKALSSLLTVVSEGCRVLMPNVASQNGDQTSNGRLKNSARLHTRLTNDAVPEFRARRRVPTTFLEAAKSLPTTTGGVNLSGRELQIIRLLVNGASNKEIAAKLAIEENTVKVHLRACFGKIGARNRTQAAVWASTNIARH